MADDSVVDIADGFWNIRGSFKVLGLLNLGTQASLVRLKAGGFVLLDAYSLRGDVARRVLELTDQGRDLRAILNLHPFHTIHVDSVSRRFPQAKLYGTARHHARQSSFPWQPLRTEDPELHALFADDFDFSVPQGVDFISSNDKLHFSSVLAFHRDTQTLHVDDTLTWNALPVVGGLSFHPTLKWVLQKRPGAVAEFRAWAEQLVLRCESVRHLCAAHGRELPDFGPGAPSVARRVQGALDKIQDTLDAHERRFG